MSPVQGPPHHTVLHQANFGGFHSSQYKDELASQFRKEFAAEERRRREEWEPGHSALCTACSRTGGSGTRGHQHGRAGRVGQGDGTQHPGPPRSPEPIQGQFLQAAATEMVSLSSALNSPSFKRRMLGRRLELQLMESSGCCNNLPNSPRGSRVRSDQQEPPQLSLEEDASCWCLLARVGAGELTVRAGERHVSKTHPEGSPSTLLPGPGGGGPPWTAAARGAALPAAAGPAGSSACPPPRRGRGKAAPAGTCRLTPGRRAGSAPPAEGSEGAPPADASSGAGCSQPLLGTSPVCGTSPPFLRAGVPKVLRAALSVSKARDAPRRCRPAARRPSAGAAPRCAALRRHRPLAAAPGGGGARRGRAGPGRLRQTLGRSGSSASAVRCVEQRPPLPGRRGSPS